MDMISNGTSGTVAGARERARAFGLDDVVVADTELSEVDGKRGTLTVRGHSIEALAGTTTFEAMAGLLWDGALPGEARTNALREELGRARALAAAALPELHAVRTLADPMDALRAGVAALPASELDDERVGVTGALPVFAGAWLAARRGTSAVMPDPDRSHAEDVLRLLGCDPSASKLRALESYLCTVADHGFNASTFTARVVASTGSDTVSAVVAALGALKGKLHGGAPGPVLDLLDRVATPERARAVLEAELAAGERIMGMGHRVYRTRDPRAAVLERTLTELGAEPATGRLALARRVEQEAEALLAERHPERALKANVEFFTAVLLEAVGLGRELFTAVFAMGRVLGWCAHIDEQRRAGRIVRPAARYVGPRAA
jgi:citrate synthase